MRIKSHLIFLLFAFSALILFESLLSSCASRSAPGGGPKDTIAPVLDTAFPPNMSTNFTGKEVTLVFNEYIALRSPSQQISFSPPLKNKPTITNKGKEVTINWKKDTLLDSTTYIISFGNAITDFTEGNVNEKIKYVFSTGDFIDSLSLEGSVINSDNGEGVPKIMVGLYDLNTIKGSDSIPFKNLPTYYTYTTESGYFSLGNLKYGEFAIIAFEDNRGNFKMATGLEKVAFTRDTITTSLNPKRITLKAFDPQTPDRYYGTRHASQGKVQVSFNYAPKNVEIEFLDSSLSNEFHYVSMSPSKDTANFWFKQGDRDTLKLLVRADGKTVDTAVVLLRDFGTAPFSLGLLYKEVKFNEPIRLKANAPVKSANDSLMFIHNKKDTVGVKLQPSADNPLLVILSPEKRMDVFQLVLRKGAVESIFGEKNDSLAFDGKTLKREDLGNLDFTVKADTLHPKVLQMFTPEEVKIVDTTFTGEITLKFRNMKAGTYEAQLILDENGDGKWTTGNYLEGRQPEIILNFKEKAEIRANWDLELEWIPDIPTPQSRNSKESRSDKN